VNRGCAQLSTKPSDFASGQYTRRKQPGARLRGRVHAVGRTALCELILERRPHPEQGFRACIGILRLVRPFGAERLEAAAARAIEIGALSYGSVRSILDHKLDRQAAHQRPADGAPIVHTNIRGARYYH
jgi:transposase